MPSTMLKSKFNQEDRLTGPLSTPSTLFSSQPSNLRSLRSLSSSSLLSETTATTTTTARIITSTLPCPLSQSSFSSSSVIINSSNSSQQVCSHSDKLTSSLNNNYLNLGSPVQSIGRVYFNANNNNLYNKRDQRNDKKKVNLIKYNKSTHHTNKTTVNNNYNSNGDHYVKRRLIKNQYNKQNWLTEAVRLKTYASISKKCLPMVLIIFQLFNLFPLSFALGSASSSTTGSGARCPSMCECIWRGGKPTAECAGQNLMNIPSGIPNFYQILNLSRNNFQTLPPKVFQERGLINLQKVYLSECKLGRLAPDAFIQLTNLVDLDLSSNLLTSIPSESLRYTSSLRRLNLHGNPIQAIKEDSFINLPHLVSLDLSDCQIDTIEPGSLKNLKSLEQLKLDGNRLSTLPAGTFVGLPLLNIGLHRNPWKCDCELRPTLEWLNKARLTPNVPPSCSTPSKLAGLMWNSLELSAYACPPVFKVSETELKTTIGSNLSFVCTVKSTPQAKIYWSCEELDTSNSSSSCIVEGGKYSVVEDLFIGPDLISSTLTVHSIDYSDARRHYICIAENQAETTSKNFTITLIPSALAFASGWSKVEIAGSVITFLLGFILTLVLVAVCLMRNRKDFCGQGNDKSSASGPGSVDVLKNTKYGGGGGNGGSPGDNKLISESRLKQSSKDITGSSSGYGSNGVTPDLTSNVIKSMDYTPMCPTIDYYPGLLQVSNPMCKADSCELISDHHPGNTAALMAAAAAINGESTLPLYNNYENYDAYAAHAYQQQLMSQQAALAAQQQGIPETVGYTNFNGSYVGLTSTEVVPMGIPEYGMEQKRSESSFTTAAPVQQPIHEANLVNLHHVNVVGQGSYNISHPTIVRYSPDEGYAEEQANPPYILEGTEV